MATAGPCESAYSEDRRILLLCRSCTQALDYRMAHIQEFQMQRRSVVPFVASPLQAANIHPLATNHGLCLPLPRLYSYSQWLPDLRQRIANWEKEIECGECPPFCERSNHRYPCCLPHSNHESAIFLMMPMSSGRTGFCLVMCSSAQNQWFGVAWSCVSNKGMTEGPKPMMSW